MKALQSVSKQRPIGVPSCRVSTIDQEDAADEAFSNN